MDPRRRRLAGALIWAPVEEDEPERKVEALGAYDFDPHEPLHVAGNIPRAVSATRAPGMTPNTCIPRLHDTASPVL